MGRRVPPGQRQVELLGGSPIAEPVGANWFFTGILQGMAYRKASYRQRYRGTYRVVHKMVHIVSRHIVERYREGFGTSALVTGILQEFFGGLTYQEGSYLDCHRAVYRDVYRNERYENRT